MGRVVGLSRANWGSYVAAVELSALPRLRSLSSFAHEAGRARATTVLHMLHTYLGTNSMH